MRKYILPLILFIIIFGGFLTYCYFRKEVVVTGFGCYGDIITVKRPNGKPDIISIKGNRIYSSRVYFFYEKFTWFTLNGDIRLQVEIDSARKKLLDTAVLLERYNGAPFISIEDPTKNHFKRSFFTGTWPANDVHD